MNTEYNLEDLLSGIVKSHGLREKERERESVCVGRESEIFVQTAQFDAADDELIETSSSFAFYFTVNPLKRHETITSLAPG